VGKKGGRSKNDPVYGKKGGNQEILGCYIAGHWLATAFIIKVQKEGQVVRRGQSTKRLGKRKGDIKKTTVLEATEKQLNQPKKATTLSKYRGKEGRA